MPCLVTSSCCEMPATPARMPRAAWWAAWSSVSERLAPRYLDGTGMRWEGATGSLEKLKFCSEPVDSQDGHGPRTHSLWSH